MAETTGPVLTPEDLRSATWQKIEKHLNARIDGHRRANDGDLDDKKTQKLRGRIAEALAILGLARAIPTVAPEPPEPT